MKRRTLTSVLVSVFVVTAVALAYFAVSTTFTGSGSAKAANEVSAAMPAKVSFAEGIAPGGAVPVKVNLENNQAHSAKIKTAKATVTSSNAECSAHASTWFTVTSTNKEWAEVLAGEKAAVATQVYVGEKESYEMSNGAGAGAVPIELKMPELATTNEASCAGSTITVALTVSS
jgi:hypothetical protein